ncbi:hypothetical protein AG1IA_06956 [Rhizoctonia solani AG-1 IA]|uniref:Uncharacterized protein n=1 Tax=Thanatephorus cucumeris (strain AG1-IA) TaxID=983506 RepID=L8WRK9_THACA|nr:hypothetical protein AG1IA_06956 [Rhizoctonia solani AG-1 IA]
MIWELGCPAPEEDNGPSAAYPHSPTNDGGTCARTRARTTSAKAQGRDGRIRRL